MENNRNNTRRDGGNRFKKSNDFKEKRNGDSYGDKKFGSRNMKDDKASSYGKRNGGGYASKGGNKPWHNSDAEEGKSFAPRASYGDNKKERGFRSNSYSGFAGGKGRGRATDKGYKKNFSSNDEWEETIWTDTDGYKPLNNDYRDGDRKGGRGRYDRKGGNSDFYGRGERRFDNKPAQRKGSAPVQKNKEEGVRLNKYIANAGICSRREADVLIASGAVSVNGEIVTQMGFKVKPEDVVNYGGERLVSEKKRYVLLNKPKGYITTSDDPQERKTVMMLIENACKERVYPVGRLDRNTTGVLLFTNDGDMAKKLTHPSTGARKIYHVELDKNLTHADMQRMREGLMLEDGEIMVDDVQYVGNGEKRNVVGVVLHSGRNRIVRRIFEAMGYEVCKLDRVLFAELTKKDLPRGRWRLLSEKEVSFLKML